MAAHNNLAEQGLRPYIAKERKLSWGSRTLGGAERFAALASVVQTGKMQGRGLAELGARVLGGRPDRFGFGAGPPHRTTARCRRRARSTNRQAPQAPV